MNETIVESLVAKTNAAIIEVSELNLVVRGIGNLHNPINRINERVDVINANQQKSENTIKEIRDTLDGIQKTLKTIQQTQQTIEESIKALPEQLAIRVETIDALKKRMEGLSYQLTRPVKNEIEHHHHFTWPLVVGFAMVFIGIMAICWARKSNDSSESTKANDIKYRELKTLDHPYLTTYLYHLDSLYISDPQGFTSRTEEKERALLPK